MKLAKSEQNNPDSFYIISSFYNLIIFDIVISFLTLTLIAWHFIFILWFGYFSISQFVWFSTQCKSLFLLSLVLSNRFYANLGAFLKSGSRLISLQSCQSPLQTVSITMLLRENLRIFLPLKFYVKSSLTNGNCFLGPKLIKIKIHDQ